MQQRYEYIRAGPAKGDEIAVAWLCPAPFYVFGCFWTWCLLCTSQQIESRSLLFFVRDMTDSTIRNNTRATITCLKKKRKKGAGFPFVCTCGSSTRLKFQIEARKIEWGIAVMPLVLITTCHNAQRSFFWSYLLMGDELGQRN